MLFFRILRKDPPTGYVRTFDGLKGKATRLVNSSARGVALLGYNANARTRRKRSSKTLNTYIDKKHNLVKTRYAKT